MSKKTAKSKRSLIIKRIAIGLVISLGLFIAFVTFAAAWTGSTQPIKNVANELKTPAGWELTSENVEPPRILCIDASCDQLSRHWQASSLNRNTIEDLLKKTGWSFYFEEPCTSMENHSRKSKSEFLCSIQASQAKYRIYLSINQEQAKYNIRMYVSRK